MVKICLYGKNLHKAKYQYLINIREKVGIDHHDDRKAYIEYSKDMRDVYKNIDEYNPDKENKTLVVLDDMIADMVNNRKLDSAVNELIIRGRKLNIFLLNIFIAKIPNERELQQNAVNHSSDISTKDFINIHRECTAEPYSFFSY